MPLNQVVRFTSVLATPVTATNGSVTKVEDGTSTAYLRGLQNRTGGDIYWAYATTAPADNTTMILMVNGADIYFSTSEIPVGNLYVYQNQGSNKTVHVITGV